MKRITMALLFFGLVGAPASAQSLREISNRPIQITSPDAQAVAAQRDRERADRDALNTATWVYITSAAADWSVTAVCARVVCFDEHSVTGLFLYGVEDPKIAIPIGIGIDALIVYGVRELVAPDHPKLARALLYGSSAVRLVLTVSKVNDLREHTRRDR